MKKSARWIGSIALLLILLVGGWLWLSNDATVPDTIEAEHYRIYHENGKTYLSITEEDYESEICSSGDTPVYFSSVKEMKQELVSGKLSTDAIVTMMGMIRSENGRVTKQIVDLNHLYNFTYPLGMQCQSIAWYGSRYTGVVTKGASVCAGVTFCNDSYYQSFFSAEYAAPMEREYDQLISDEIVSDRNARQICYIQTMDSYKKKYYKEVFYTVQGRSGTTYVRERYDLSVSETVPQKVCFFGEVDENANFFGELIKPEKRPSVAYLESFGLRKLGLW